MPALAARGVEIAWSEWGEGRPVLLIHETAAVRAIWEPLATALSESARAISYDRRGWGGSSAPDGYRRTTVEEQSEDAAALIESAAEAPAVVAGAGLGAVIALDLLLRRADLASAGLLIEPPLLQLLPVATESLSDDRRRLEAVVGSADDLVELLPLRRAAGARAGRQPVAGGDGRGRPEAAGEPARRAGHRRGLADATAAACRRGEGNTDRHLRVDPAHPARRRGGIGRPAGGRDRTRGQIG